MRIRPAVPSDLSYILELGRAFPYIKNPTEFFLRRIVEGHVLVFEVREKPVAFIDYELDGDSVIIHGIVVREDLRGLGIGKRLLRAVEEIVRPLGVRTIRLMTLEENVPARRLYERNGLVVEKKEGRVVWYVKHLTPSPEGLVPS